MNKIYEELGKNQEKVVALGAFVGSGLWFEQLYEEQYESRFPNFTQSDMDNKIDAEREKNWNNICSNFKGGTPNATLIMPDKEIFIQQYIPNGGPGSPFVDANPVNFYDTLVHFLAQTPIKNTEQNDDFIKSEIHIQYISGNLLISGNSFVTSSVRIYDVTGKEIKIFKVNSNKCPISIPLKTHYSNGCYLVEYRDRMNSAVKQIYIVK